MSPTFTQAAAFVFPFGQFQGQKLDDIAKTDEGLQYLDWLRGQGIRSPDLRNATAVYLDDATIAKDLAEILERKGIHR